MSVSSPSEAQASVALQTAVDAELRRYREQVSARIAGVVIVGTLVLISFAVWHAAVPENYSRMKDLLLFVNPLLGVVIGYYFTKTSTEARAEQAETTAKQASITAQQATQGRDRAAAETKEAIGSLAQLEQAASSYLARAATAPEGVTTLSGDDDATTAIPDPQLRFALERARRVLDR